MSIRYEAFPIGIEEEYLLIDPETRALAGRQPAGFMGRCKEILGSRVTHEFLQSQVEIGTGVCRTVGEARAELLELRHAVAASAEEFGMRMIAASTHPWSHWRDQEPVDMERYRILGAENRSLARRMAICGMHVHAGIEDLNLRVDLMNQVSYFMPHLLALSTSSPFWEGHDTGLKAFRPIIIGDLPRSGLPEVLMEVSMAGLPIRQDYAPSDLRTRAARDKDRRAALRLLAIANALEGMTRAEAARLAGMERQALHDAIRRFNAEGPDGLHDRHRTGRPEQLTADQQAALKARILRGPEPERDGVSAWRLVDQRFESLYLFAACRAGTDETFALALPRVNADAMTIFLEHFAHQLEPSVHAVLVLDQAGWHDARALHVPETITLLPFPPASPQLNPVERVWLYLRERYLSHRMLDDYEAVLEAVCRAWNRLLDETGRLTSLTAYPNLTASGVP